MEVGNYVMINKDVVLGNGYAKIAQERKYPLFVYQINTADSVYVYTKDLATNGFQNNPFTISKSFVTVITTEELKKAMTRVNKDHLKEMKEKEKTFKKRHIALDKRPVVNFGSKQLIQTLNNYCKTYQRSTLEACKNVITPNTSVYQNQIGATCCSFSKTTFDIVVYIPKSWLNYFGYNATDLKAWMNFISQCEIGFTGKVLSDTKSMRSVFGSVSASTNLNAKTNNFYMNPEEECFEVLVPAGTRNMTTYLYFILVRFIYSSKYWNIPQIAMKLKKNIPTATHWECLLLAHSYENYDSYYSLVGNESNNTAVPSRYNSPINILNNLQTTSMNGAFKRYSENFSTLRRAITDGNYETIGEFLNKYRNVN